MKPAPRKPTVPRNAAETARHAVIDLLCRETRSAKEFSAELRLTEREVYDHLEHIRRSLHAEGAALEIVPAVCRSCGFTFAKRDRLTAPGRCPVCRHEAISDPLYTIHRPGHEPA